MAHSARTRVATAIGLAVAVLLLPGGAGARAAASFPPATVAALDAIVKNGMTTSRTPGMAVGIWVPGRGTYVRTFGTDNVMTNSPFRVQDKIRIASISKTFTATAILQLVDRGRLKLSDHLSRFVKSIRNGSVITIKQMLNMTAGIYDFTNDATFLSDYQANPQMPFSLQRLLKIIHRHKPSFAPGTSVEYSDSNYYLLGVIAEKLTHRSLARVIRAGIIDRLQMRGTSYPSTSQMPTPFARGYFNATPTGPLRDVTLGNPAIAGGAGAVISRLNDLKVYAKALATGTLIARATQRQRLQTVVLGGVPGKITLRYGLGILNINGFLGHNGAILGYGSAMFYLPSAHATFVVEGNNNDLVKTVPTDIFIQLADLLFPAQFPGGI